MVLTRFAVWKPDAQIFFHRGGAQLPMVSSPPDTRFFKGTIAGAPGSWVVLTVQPNGQAAGTAFRGASLWAVGRGAASAAGPAAAAAPGGAAAAPLASRKATAEDFAAARRSDSVKDYCPTPSRPLRPNQPARRSLAGARRLQAVRRAAVGLHGGGAAHGVAANSPLPCIPLPIAGLQPPGDPRSGDRR